MTNFTTRMMIAAATLVVAAGSASAQVLTAEIPFAFRAGSAMLAAGTYELNAVKKEGVPIYRIWNVKEHRYVLLTAGATGDPKKSWAANGEPVLSFECGAHTCALAAIWSGPTAPTYVFPHQKPGKDEPTRTAVVVMRPANGE